MKETKRTEFIKKLYANQIKDLLYEEFTDYDGVKKIRAYIVISESFGLYDEILRLQNFGISSPETIKYLEDLGYKNKDIYDNAKKLII